MSSIKTVWNDRAATGFGTRRAAVRPWYRFADVLLKNVTPGIALDVGCGVGEFLSLLDARGFRAMGVDANAEQIEQVREKGFASKVVDLEEALSFDDASFDLVTCLEVVEHIARAEFFLKEVNRILKPDGALLISTPNFSFINNRVHYFMGEAPMGEGIHLRFFNPARLQKVLSAAQFRVVARNSYGIVPVLGTINERVRKQDAPLWRVPHALESVLAYDMIYLARKNQRI